MPPISDTHEQPCSVDELLRAARALPLNDRAALASLLQADVTAAHVAEATRSRFISDDAIEAEFGITKRATRTARQRGQLKGRRVGHAVLFDRADVEAFIADRTPRGVEPRTPGGDVEAIVARALATRGRVASEGGAR